MSKIYLTSFITIMFPSAGLLFDQSNKEVDKKTKTVKGNITKISIATTEGEKTFYDAEAEKLFNRITSSSSHKLVEIISYDSDSLTLAKDIKILVDDGDDTDIKTLVLDDKNGDHTIKTITVKDGSKKRKNP